MGYGALRPGSRSDSWVVSQYRSVSFLSTLLLAQVSSSTALGVTQIRSRIAARSAACLSMNPSLLRRQRDSPGAAERDVATRRFPARRVSSALARAGQDARRVSVLSRGAEI